MQDSPDRQQASAERLLARCWAGLLLLSLAELRLVDRLLFGTDRRPDYEFVIDNLHGILAGTPVWKAWQHRVLPAWTFALVERVAATPLDALRWVTWGGWIAANTLLFELLRRKGARPDHALVGVCGFGLARLALTYRLEYPWDQLDILIFLSFGLAAARGVALLRLWPLLLVGTLNHETILYVPLWYALASPEPGIARARRLALSVLAGGVLCTWALREALYLGPPALPASAFETVTPVTSTPWHLMHNLRQLFVRNPPTDRVFVSLALIAVVAWCGRAAALNRDRRAALWTLAILGSVICFGYINETRHYLGLLAFGFTYAWPAAEVAPTVSSPLVTKVRGLVEASFHRHRQWLGPWCALVGLWLLFDLPSTIRSTTPELSKLRPSVEVLLLVSIWGWSIVRLERRGSDPAAARVHRWVARGLGTLTALLVVYRVDQMICVFLLREELLLYEQQFMLRHLFVLIGDLMAPSTFAILLGVSAASWLLVRLTRALLARVRPLFAAERWRHTARILGALWLAALVSFAWAGVKKRAPVHSQTWSFVRNLRKSVKMHASIQAQIRTSPYGAYDAITLHDRPDVLLFLVESYGRLMFEHGRRQHMGLLDELGAKLEQAGWHAVTTFSSASVSGGRSWLAEGTILLGMPIRYEALFQQLISHQPKPPNLVRFLNRQGYESVLLVPADRDRAGIRVVNRYDFTRVLHQATLGYTGPSIGWGQVPDQFSLAAAERMVLRDAVKPLFLDFHMVTSHAPWKEVPSLEPVEDAAPAKLAEATAVTSAAAFDALKRGVRQYGQVEDGYMGALTRRMYWRYQATIEYDLRVITRYLARRPKDALVVIMGDHQPPVISPGNESYDTPVHVLSRNPQRLEEFLRHGFTPGLVPSKKHKNTLAHAGLFSLFVRALAAPGRDPSQLPPVRPNGHVH